MEPFDPLIAAKTILDQENIAPVRMDKVGHVVGQPLILLSLVDVRRMVSHRLEVAEFVVHCYSEYKDEALMLALRARKDRESTRLNSRHVKISYVFFC